MSELLHGEVRDGRPGDVHVTSYALLLIFGLLAAGIITLGYLYYQHFKTNYRKEYEKQLSAIAKLKVGELTQWRTERWGDAAVFLNNAAFSALVQRFFENPEAPEAAGLLREWLEKYQTIFQYDQIFLLDARGSMRMTMPANLTNLASAISQRIPEVLQADHVTFLDFYRDEADHGVYLAILMPILQGPGSSRPLGALVFRINPESYLYPFIKRWPTYSKTAETLLVRRDGNEAVFLNELRFATNTALNLRIPLDRITLPGAQAALGREGIMEGLDYRGLSVVAALRSIPDSPWSLVARVDTAEVYAAIRERLWIVIGMMAILLFSAGACVGLVWRQQRVRFYRDQAKLSAALAQSAEELQDKNAELERFLYAASHDLKSPVVTIRTFLGYLEKDIAAGDAGRIEKDMKFMRSATDKMAQLLDELLDISRVGRVIIPPVRVTVQGLVDEALIAVAGGIAAHGVTLTVSDPDVTVFGDRIRLAEIWQNLIDNAVKFMGSQKEPRIEIGVETRGAETVFFVRDNGVGIDPRYHEKVFGLFEKLDPRAEGSGMGLALVKRIVELYKGRIWVESPGTGQGACFFFTLPEAVESAKQGVRT
jgi:signal transduction histidine kinase